VCNPRVPPMSSELSTAAKAEIDRTLKVLGNGFVYNMFSWFMMIPARPAMIGAAMGGDVTKTTTAMANMTSAASLMEFLLTPTLGVLSDKVGRRPVLLGSAAVAAVARLVTFLAADTGGSAVVYANYLDRAFSGSAFPLFITTAFASAADLAKKHGHPAMLSALTAKVQSTMGVALVLSPPLGALVMQKFGPKYPALLAVLVSAAHFSYMRDNYVETRPEPAADDAPPPTAEAAAAEAKVAAGRSNPLSFLAFFRGDATTATLSLAYLLYSLPVEMHDVRMSLMRQFKLTDGETAKVLALLGVGTVVGGISTGPGIKALGPRAYTAAASACAVAFHLAWARAHDYPTVTTTTLFSTFASSATAPLKTALTVRAMAAGMLPGQISGSLSNLQGATKVVMPQVYSRLFAMFGQQAPFVFAAMATVAGLLVFNSVKEKQGSKEKGEKGKGEQKEK